MRTVYRITSRGRAAFREELHRQFEQEGPVSQTLYGALLFLHLCDLDVVEALVRARIARLDQLIAKLDPIRKELRDVLSTGGAHLLAHVEKQRHLDREWLVGLLKDITARRVQDVADPHKLGPGPKSVKRNAGR
jgi:hypothetical protein